MINKWQGLLRSSQTEVQITLAVLFSENKGKFWSIDCHHLLICFLYIDLQPNSAAPRVHHSGPSNRGVLWKTKVLHNFLHYFYCIHVLFASSCASDSGPHFYSFFGGGGGWGKANKVNYKRWCANGEWSEIYQPPAKFEHFAKNYSSTTNEFLKATQEQSTQSGSLISDVCCYSQPPFSKLIHTMGGGRSPDHGSLPVAENECLWPRVSYMKAGDFLACEQAHWYVQCTTIPFRCWGLDRHKFSPDSHNWAFSHFLCWPSRWSGLRPCHVRTQRTSRSQACTDLHFGVHVVPSAQFPCRFTIVLCIKIPTFHIVSHPTFFLNHDLIFWSH